MVHMFGGINASVLSWKMLEAVMSGRDVPDLVPAPDTHRHSAHVHPAATAFAELHCTSSYSFLGGASDPEELVERAVQLGLTGLALTDRDGFYGAVAFAEAARDTGLETVFGAELSLEPDRALTVLAIGYEGYVTLSHLITDAHMASGEKDVLYYPPLETIAAAGGLHVLVDHAWLPELDRIVDCFGAQNVSLEYQVRGLPEDADQFADLDRADPRLSRILSGAPRAATIDAGHLAAAKAALARRESLSQAEPHLHPLGAMWLRGADRLLRAAPGRERLVEETVRVAHRCAFAFDLVSPNLPLWDVPEPYGNEMDYLRGIVDKRTPVRYHSRPESIKKKAREQIERELAVIEELDFPGYFLIVNDIVDFCHRENIYCQGRGSAANSAVCFALGITAVEPIHAKLLFERFLSPDRDGPPDIDLDIEAGRREEVIQYVYQKYGRDNAAQVANVITYRTKGAVRDAGRALGYPQGTIDAWSRGVEEPPEPVVALAAQFKGQPRHLGIHSGGMVICDRPIADVVPTEWARMENRSVIQWDKDAAAYGGLVKFDLLGLGMLGALHHMVDQVKTHRGTDVHLWEIPLDDPHIYEMLQRADTVGVFQVESRAQMSTLPRLKPRRFFDIVVEVALVRPGPIQGGSVHPYIRRRNGQEPVTYDHPCLENALGKTLGIPLFQEQLMQMAKDAADFTGAEADELRRAMGSKRSPERMAKLKERFFDGLAATHGITGDVAQKLWMKMVAFAAYGFPESHSQSFAGLVYFSAWFKYYYPAEFTVGLLRAQPMGFYSPQSLIADARRHGITILPIDVQVSGEEADTADGGRAIRLGLNLVSGLGTAAAKRVEKSQPFTSISDLSRRADLTVSQVEALARAGALDSFGVDRRQALWQAGVAATEKPGMLPGLSAVSAPALPGMSAFELMVADVASTGVTPTAQPVAYVREALAARGIVPASQLLSLPDASRVTVAGIVTHRQRPVTAGGVTFLGVEDESGLMNVVISVGLWKRYQKVALTSKALVIRGIVRNSTGAVSIEADKLEPLPLGEVLSRGSRDFR
ncbi:error-prone DNA polymerase [Corynebacterium glucuronolyticum]|uniref:error-prone DNA polymerase n=1 Tax=Corynebacterium glucuronolyticum TaxID=39791 RepID=UPI0021AFAF84|nr:error-prone DNA polymerase [Corynebacterium glucuronolyticum]MCT1562853.1 error-prone DNA polymerase [Corynebacterium glucuronolyticum]